MMGCPGDRVKDPSVEGIVVYLLTSHLASAAALRRLTELTQSLILKCVDGKGPIYEIPDRLQGELPTARWFVVPPSGGFVGRNHQAGAAA